jgi:hypothetical protein
MLIDDFLPVYHFREVHDIAIYAPTANVFRAIKEVDFADSFLVRWLMRLRGMTGTDVRLSSFEKFSFAKLGEVPERELVLGLVGRFWTLFGGLRRIDGESFQVFNEAGYAKAAWNFSLSEAGSGTVLGTETRIQCTDHDSRRSFGFYWTFIQPFSGLIRMEMLKMIKCRAESLMPGYNVREMKRVNEGMI